MSEIFFQIKTPVIIVRHTRLKGNAQRGSHTVVFLNKHCGIKTVEWQQVVLQPLDVCVTHPEQSVSSQPTLEAKYNTYYGFYFFTTTWNCICHLICRPHSSLPGVLLRSDKTRGGKTQEAPGVAGVTQRSNPEECCFSFDSSCSRR